MTTAAGSFQVASWAEERYEELENGGGLARATVALAFSGAPRARPGVGFPEHGLAGAEILAGRPAAAGIAYRHASCGRPRPG